MFAKDKIYRFTPRAHQDLESIWLYTQEHWSLTQADCYISDILNACKGLASGEKIGVTAHTIREDYWKHFVG
jgi:toxin ParE1/3/4